MNISNKRCVFCNEKISNEYYECKSCRYGEYSAYLFTNDSQSMRVDNCGIFIVLENIFIRHINERGDTLDLLFKIKNDWPEITYDNFSEFKSFIRSIILFS